MDRSWQNGPHARTGPGLRFANGTEHAARGTAIKYDGRSVPFLNSSEILAAAVCRNPIDSCSAAFCFLEFPDAFFSNPRSFQVQSP